MLRSGFDSLSRYLILKIYDERDIVEMFPEFNRKFLNAPKNRESKAYWWEPDTELGHNARVAAFDKLIETYERKINYTNS